MIDRQAELPIKRQARLLGISRGTVYYHPEPVSEAELALMRRIDKLHLEHPFAGSRMLRDFLRQQGVRVSSWHVGTSMRRMDIQALYLKPNTSKKNPAHPVFPYALRSLAIERANRVCGWPAKAWLAQARQALRTTASVQPAGPNWVDHRQSWTSAIRWLKLGVSYPAVRSRPRPAQADPYLPVGLLQSCPMLSARFSTFVSTKRPFGKRPANPS